MTFGDGAADRPPKDAPPFAVQQHENLLTRLGDTGLAPRSALRVVPLSGRYASLPPADAPSRSQIMDEAGRPVGVLFVSSPVDPGIVARSVARAREARRLLGPDLGSVVLEPAAEGSLDGLSYALWPWHAPLSGHPIRYRVEAIPMRRLLLRWVADAVARTRQAAEAASFKAAFEAPLVQIVDDAACGERLRAAARAAIGRLERGAWKPSWVLEHGDLWLGNVLYPGAEGRATFRRGFVLIDWGGARLQGYPFLDLLRLGNSSRMSRRALRRVLREHCGILGCDTADVASHALAGLGALQLRQDHFPEAAYRAMCRSYDVLLGKLGPEFYPGT